MVALVVLATVSTASAAEDVERDVFRVERDANVEREAVFAAFERSTQQAFERGVCYGEKCVWNRCAHLPQCKKG